MQAFQCLDQERFLFARQQAREQQCGPRRAFAQLLSLCLLRRGGDLLRLFAGLTIDGPGARTQQEFAFDLSLRQFRDQGVYWRASCEIDLFLSNGTNQGCSDDRVHQFVLPSSVYSLWAMAPSGCRLSPSHSATRSTGYPPERATNNHWSLPLN